MVGLGLLQIICVLDWAFKGILGNTGVASHWGISFFPSYDCILLQSNHFLSGKVSLTEQKICRAH